MDEAGKGALAGPLVVCALWHPRPDVLLRLGARDSKLTTEIERRNFVRRLKKTVARWVVVAADAEWLNQTGMASSEELKALSAIEELRLMLGAQYTDMFLLGDGERPYPLLPAELAHKFKTKADACEPLVAAASMVAKHEHDKLVRALDKQYPGWGFASHRGYNSPDHRDLLYRMGLTPAHRERAAKSAACRHALSNHLPLPEWALKVRPYQ